MCGHVLVIHSQIRRPRTASVCSDVKVVEGNLPRDSIQIGTNIAQLLNNFARQWLGLLRLRAMIVRLIFPLSLSHSHSGRHAGLGGHARRSHARGSYGH